MHSATAPSFRADALLALGRRLQALGYRFVTVTPATHRRVNGRAQNAWARDLRGVLGWSRPYCAGALPETVDGLLRDAGLAEPYLPDAAGHPGDGAADGAGPAWRARLRASTLGERLYFHSAYPTHGEDAVFFGPDTYRYVAALRRTLPRLRRPPRRAVDIGAGAGPAAIELALLRPEATVYAADTIPRRWPWPR